MPKSTRGHHVHRVQEQLSAVRSRQLQFASIQTIVTLEVVENQQCRDWYKSQEKKMKILDSQICAGYEKGGRDSCWADSGGPLMIGEGDYTVVVGVVSAGIGCGRYRLPGLYTRLSEYVTWIEDTVREHED
ncbi:Serine proteinase stubble [Gryllus bimaculatus]|nr:Serine proteinase stubble [Gryllus bimaculatus]